MAKEKIEKNNQIEVKYAIHSNYKDFALRV